MPTKSNVKRRVEATPSKRRSKRRTRTIFKAASRATANGITGKRFVLTGELDTMERSAAKAALLQLGARVTSGISGKTNFLIAGSEAGPAKLEAAEDLGIPVLDEDQLQQLLAGRPLGEVLASTHERVEPRPQAPVQRTPPPMLPGTEPDGDCVLRAANGRRLAEGRLRNGLREGVWREYQADGATLASEVTWKTGQRHGPTTEYFDEGEPRLQCHYRKGRLHGALTRWAFPNGEKSTAQYRDGQIHGRARQCKYGVREATYVKGLPHGPYRSTWPDGTIREEGNYKHGMRHGTWRGSTREGEHYKQSYASGIPKTLSTEQLTSIAERVRNGRWEASRALSEEGGQTIADGLERALFLHLLERKLVTLSEHPELLELFDGEPTPIEHYRWPHSDCGYVPQLLRYVEGVCQKDEDSPQGLTARWPQALDELCMKSCVRNPKPLLAIWPKLAEPVRQGLALVLRRCGAITAQAMLEVYPNALHDLAMATVTYNMDTAVWMIKDNEAIRHAWYEETVERSGTTRRMTPEFNTMVHALVSEASWNEALLSLALAGTEDVEFDLHEGAYRAATVQQLNSLSQGGRRLSLHELARLFDEVRDDDPKELLWLVRNAKRPEMKLAAVCIAICRLSSEGRKIPKLAENALVELAFANSEVWEFADYVVEAARCLPPKRLQTWLESQRSDERLALLGAGDQYERGFKQLGNGSWYEPKALAAWGMAGMPVLADWYRRARRRKHRQLCKTALIYTMADLADRGRSWPAIYDHFLDFDPSVKADKTDERRAIYAFKGLTPARQIQLLVRTFTQGGPVACGAWRYVPHCRSTEVWAAAFGHLLDHPEDYSGRARKPLLNARLPHLGEERFLQWSLLNRPSPAAMRLLKQREEYLDECIKEWREAGLLDEVELDVDVRTDAADELIELAERIRSKNRQRFYALRTLAEKSSQPCLNRIGGSPPGIFADDWPHYEGRPMEFLFSIDLDTMPELRDRLSKNVESARAVCLFISDTRENSAYEPGTDETRVVFVPQTDVDAGELTEPLACRLEQAYFAPVALDVPPEVFRIRQRSKAAEEFADAISNYPARVMGEPGWIQHPEHGGPLLVQFTCDFIDINLGDQGRMYVFEDVMFFQC